MSKKCKDHLGNEFKSIKEMCKYWGISTGTFKRRKHWELEKALTTPTGKRKKKCKDHLGNEFESIRDMCKHWGINESVLRQRLKVNTLEDALTKEINHIDKGKKCKDHLGNVFQSISEMCRYWGIEINVFKGRLNRGWDLEKALTEDVLELYKRCKDHLNNEFESVRDMCSYWNIDYVTFNDRIHKGWDLEKALTTVKQKANNCKSCKDHLGNEYKSLVCMCKHWGITVNNFNCRLKKGWNLEQILTTPERRRCDK